MLWKHYVRDVRMWLIVLPVLFKVAPKSTWCHCFPDCCHGVYKPGLQDRRSTASNTRCHQCFPPLTTAQRQKVSIYVYSWINQQFNVFICSVSISEMYNVNLWCTFLLIMYSTILKFFSFWSVVVHMQAWFHWFAISLNSGVLFCTLQRHYSIHMCAFVIKVLCTCLYYRPWH